MPQPLRDYLVADINRMMTRLAAIDAQLQQLAGQTPEERRAFMRRMTRRISLPGAWLLVGAAVAYTSLRRHPGRTGLATGLILGAAVVWALLPAPAPPVPPPPDRAVPSPTATPPTSTPSPPAPPTPVLPSPGGVGAEPTGPPGPGTPTSPPGPGPTTSPPPPEEREHARCLRLRPSPSVNLDRCVERVGELVDG